MDEPHLDDAATKEPCPTFSAAEHIREAEAIRISVRRFFEAQPGPDRPAAA